MNEGRGARRNDGGDGQPECVKETESGGELGSDGGVRGRREMHGNDGA